MDIGTLKPFVNDPMLYKAFQSYIENELEVMNQSLARVTEMNEVFRLQGEIARLRKFYRLRDYVNNGRKS